MNGVMLLFSIFDQKSDAFMRPFAAPTKAFAIRTFGDMVKDPESMVSRHPADFFLFQVAKMDEETGEVTPEKCSLGCAVEFVQQPKLVGEAVGGAS